MESGVFTEPNGDLDLLIPTRDRSTRLAATLSGIAAQEIPSSCQKVCLYLLDNGTTSAFSDFDVARQLDALEWRGIETHYLRRPGIAGIYSIRKHLYQVSDSSVVCYLDDDIALPPGAIKRLWSGLFEQHFVLASSFIMATDSLQESQWNNRGPRSISNLIRDIVAGKVTTAGDHWVEMMGTAGTNLMFRRSDFDATGAWETVEPFFAQYPYASGEDVALCIALKSRGEAFMDVADLALHFSPKQRHFTSLEHGPVKVLRRILAERFGVEHISALRSRREQDSRSEELLKSLQSLADRLGRQKLQVPLEDDPSGKEPNVIGSTSAQSSASGSSIRKGHES